MLHMALVSCCLLTAMPADSPTPAELSVYQAAAAKAGGRRLAATFGWHRGAKFTGCKSSGTSTWGNWSCRRTIRPFTVCWDRSATTVSGECRRRSSKTIGQS